MPVGERSRRLFSPEKLSEKAWWDCGDIIYSFCKMYALDKKVDQLLPLSAKNGLMNIVYDSGTFIRNQNIKGCDYD